MRAPTAMNPCQARRRVLAWSSILFAVLVADAGSARALGIFNSAFDQLPLPVATVLSADLNGDAVNDLLTPWWVSLGQGPAKFAPPLWFLPSNREPTGFALQDVNADGKMDVVDVLNDSLWVFLGRGDGAFDPPITSYSGFRSHGVAMADMDNDGHVDAFVDNPSPGYSVRLLRGQGDGTFVTASSLPTSAEYYYLVAADLNHDGRIDLIGASQLYTLVYVHLGNGDGTFGPASSISTGGVPRGLTTADLNLDGHVDLVLPCQYSATGLLTVLRGKGDGSFLADLYSPNPGGSAVAADFNGDGVLDIMTGGDGTVLVRLGQPGGTYYGSVQTFFSTGSVSTVQDFDSDGHLDVITSWMCLLRGHGDGTFGESLTWTCGPGAIALATGDVNHDGAPDLAVANRDLNLIKILRGNGDLTFAPSVNYPTGSRAEDVALVDMNADGHLDLVGADYNDGTISIRLGLGDGTFGPRVAHAAGPGVLSVAPGDVNGDGLIDLVYSRYASLDIRLATAPLIFGAAWTYSMNSGNRRVLLADLNEDGHLDFVVANASITTALLGDGAGHASPTSAQLGKALSIAIGDVDADGHLDVAAADRGSVTLDFGRGDGSFEPPLGYLIGGNYVGAYFYGMQLVDLDSDGDLDLVATAAGPNAVEVFLNDGDRLFGPPQAFGIGPDPIAVASADFDRDGRVDLATTTLGLGLGSILHNRVGLAGIPEIARPQPSLRWTTFPQPARGAFTLRLELPSRQAVSMRVLDVQGRERDAKRFGELDEGRHDLRWAARSGSGLPPGIYFLELRTNRTRSTRRIVLLP